MIIELLCRFSKVLSEKENSELEEELSIQELIKGGDFDKIIEKDKLLSTKVSHEYVSTVLDLKDVAMFNSSDETHTTIRLYNGAIFNFKIGYDNFKAIYQTLTGKIINSFTEEDGKTQMTNGK